MLTKRKLKIEIAAESNEDTILGIHLFPGNLLPSLEQVSMLETALRRG